MTIHFLVTVFAAATIALAQMPSNSTTSGPVDLVRPVPGVPLSAEQVEERASSDATREVTRYSIYRDAAGRLRIESIDAQPNNASLYLLDPTTGAKVML